MSTDFSGHYNSYKGGDSDAFLAKVSPGGVLQWSAFVGGNSTDLSNGIVLDSYGNAVVTGTPTPPISTRAAAVPTAAATHS